MWGSAGSWKPAARYKQAAAEHVKSTAVAAPEQWRLECERWPQRVCAVLRQNFHGCKVFSFSQHPGLAEERVVSAAAFFALSEIKKRRGKTIPSVIPFSSSQTAYCSLNINWQAWASLHFDYCYLYNYLWLTGYDSLQNVNKSVWIGANWKKSRKREKKN